MILNKNNSYIVIATDTGQEISVHPYHDRYTMDKAKAAALASNEQWKESVNQAKSDE